MPKGLLLAELLTKYREQALTYTEIDISKKTMSEPFLRFALLGLQGMNLIARTPDGRYVLSVAGPSIHDLMDENRRSKATADAIMSTVMTESGKYSKDELRIKLESTAGVSSAQFEGILNALLMQQQITLVDGKLNRRT